jgi:hypothetical protein
MADQSKIRLSSAESLVLPGLALYDSADKKEKLSALNSDLISEPVRRVGMIIIGEPVENPQPEEKQLAEQYTKWASQLQEVADQSGS